MAPSTLPAEPWSQVAVIKSNPEQSKHLQTARMKVGDLELDLVNLRSETYTSSRIPDSTPFGTPEQDALRRDFTINSLFYNINTGEAGAIISYDSEIANWLLCMQVAQS